MTVLHLNQVIIVFDLSLTRALSPSLTGNASVHSLSARVCSHVKPPPVSRKRSVKNKFHSLSCGTTIHSSCPIHIRNDDDQMQTLPLQLVLVSVFPHHLNKIEACSCHSWVFWQHPHHCHQEQINPLQLPQLCLFLQTHSFFGNCMWIPKPAVHNCFSLFACAVATTSFSITHATASGCPVRPTHRQIVFRSRIPPLHALYKESKLTLRRNFHHLLCLWLLSPSTMFRRHPGMRCHRLL